MSIPWGGLFLYDLGVLPDYCFSRPFHVHVVPSVPVWQIDLIVVKKDVVAALFAAVKDKGFGTPEFVATINVLSKKNPDISVESMYRTAAMLVLVDQRKKLQYLVQPYVPSGSGRRLPWNMQFTPGGGGIGRDAPKTRKELRTWKKRHLKQNPEFLDVFEKQIVRSRHRLDSLSNVMNVIEGGYQFDSGDLVLLFNDCGTFFGGVYAYVEPRGEQQKMIGIRASISRLLYCHKSSSLGSEQCLVRLLGRVFYGVRCLLARMDGYDTASVQNPIGDMAEMIRRLPPELQMMMKGRAPFDDTPQKTMFLTQPFDDDVRAVHIPSYRKPLGVDTIRKYFTVERLRGAATLELYDRRMVEYFQ